MKKNNYSSLEIFVFIWSNIKKNKKLFLLLIFPIILIGSLSESITITAIIPFLISIFEKNNSYTFNLPLINNLTFTNPNTIFNYLILIVFGALFFRLTSIYLYSKWVSKVGTDFSDLAFSYFTNIEYTKYRNNSKVEITNIMHTSINNTIAVIFSYITIFSSLITSIGFIVTGLILNPNLFLLIFILLIIVYTMIFVFSRDKLLKVGNINHEFVQRSYNFIDYAYKSFKSIKLENSQLKINSLYRKNDDFRRKKGHQKRVLTTYPKLIIESFAILIMAIIIKTISNSNNNITQIGIDIFVISLILSRLLPVFQLIYYSWSNIKVCSFSVFKLKEFLSTKNQSKIIKNKKIKSLKKLEKIDIQNLGQSYLKQEIFANLNFEIYEGEWIGIYGKSGTGKSTLIDILMGLEKPKTGKVLVNGKDIYKNNFYFSWRNQISHCPVESDLIDKDVINNIKSIFDEKELNEVNLEKAWYCAVLDDFLSIEDCKKIYLNKKIGHSQNINTFSSGQQKRISIAKTLYKDKLLYTLDEFTNSLDKKTESIILNRMKEIYGSKTMIIVSHKEKPIEYCDKLIDLYNYKNNP